MERPPSPSPDPPVEGERLPAPRPTPLPGPVPPGGWDSPIPPAGVPAELAGWWSRVGAMLVDGIVISLPAFAVLGLFLVLLAGPLGAISISDSDAGILVGILLVIVVVLLALAAILATALLYAPLTMRRPGARNGQTWGKQLFRIRVARMGGEPQTFASAAAREVGVKFLLFGLVGGTLASIPTLLDVLWPLWDDENRALHDMVADTRVVHASRAG